MVRLLGSERQLILLLPAFLAKPSSPELTLSRHVVPPHHSRSSLLLPTSPQQPVPR